MLRFLLLVVGLAVSLGACGSSVQVFGGGGSGGEQGEGGNDPCDLCAAYSPVCGIDGETYNGACDGVCVSVEVMCTGACPCDRAAICARLDDEYRQALTASSACDPLSDIEECTLVIDGSLSCPCPVVVNPGNTGAIATMESLRATWVSQACSEGEVCDDVECPPVTGGVCLPSPGGPTAGRCDPVSD